VTSRDDELVDALVQTTFTVTGVLTRIAAEHDLSLTQLRVLGILQDRRLRMAGLAGFLGLDRSTLSGLVDRAERRGLLRREPSTEDRRAIEVAMTDAGRELAERIRGRLSDELAPVLSRLDPARRDGVVHGLQSMLTTP
jgi:DNA-binding MarR family transcriptional regulator